MYAFLNKYGQALAFGIGVLITIIFLISIFSADESVMSTLSSETAGPEKYDTDIFNFGMYAAAFMTVLALFIAVVFGIIHFVDNPKESIKGLIGVALLAVIVIIGYSMANGDLSQEPDQIVNAIHKFEESQEVDFTGANLKFISGAILAALIMVGLSILSLIIFGIRGLFK